MTPWQLHPWEDAIVTWGNLSNKYYQMRGIELPLPANHQVQLSSSILTAFAAPIVCWLLCCRPPSSFVVACRQSIVASLASFFDSLALRRSCHQSPPTFAARHIVSWLLSCYSLPAFVDARRHTIVNALVTGHFCHCCQLSNDAAFRCSPYPATAHLLLPLNDCCVIAQCSFLLMHTVVWRCYHSWWLLLLLSIVM